MADARKPHGSSSNMASSSSHRDTDESSRDSGFGEMECESMPMDFADSSLDKTLTPLKLKNLDLEMDDLVIEESLEIPTSNMICTKKEELEVKTVLSNMRLLRKGLADVTNSVRSSFAESPKSRKSLFVRPYLRSTSMYNKRKHGDHDSSTHYKRHKVGGVVEEDENVPTCSVSSASLRSSRPSLMFRVQSSSVLEMGHHLPQFNEVHYHLETVTTNDSQAFRRIDATTLCRLMKSMSSQDFAAKYVLVDCRYPYEFNGGHIKGAINIFDINKCEEIFYPSNNNHRAEIQRRVPIFYCEYSQKRGPSMAQMLRKIDRQRNVEVYPKVDFPEIYVVDKGYRNFFEMLANSSDRNLCEPCNYVTMVDCRFVHHLKKFNFHKKSWGSTTCSKSISSQSRLALRNFSDGALDSPSSTGTMKPSSRRPLFNATPKTPEPTPPTPIRQLHFS